MNSKICDQITCGIITGILLISAIMSKELLFTAAGGILCGIMWVSILYGNGAKGNVNFAGTAHNTNMYLVVLLGIYIFYTSGLTLAVFPVIKEFFLNPVIIAWIVVMILGRFAIKIFFNTGYIRKILGVLLNSIFNVAVAWFFTGADSAVSKVMLVVTVYAALLSLSRVLQNAASAAVVDTSWVVIVMLPLILVDTVMGKGVLYSWLVLGKYTLPVWWVTLALIAMAAVNLCVGLASWKKASFGASIILFVAALYYGEILGTGFHLGMVIICALLADLTVKHLIGKNIIKSKTYELLIAYAFFVPATLVFSAIAANHNDLVLCIAAVLLLGVFAVVNWKLPIDSSVGIFTFGMAFTALFLSVRYVSGEASTSFLAVVAVVFWVIFALGFGRNRLYKTAVEDMTMTGIMKYVLYLFAAAALCISLYTVTQMKTVFYLEKQPAAVTFELKEIGEILEGEDASEEGTSEEAAEGEAKEKEKAEADAETEKEAEPVIVKGVIKGDAAEIKSITMQWDKKKAITCTAEEAAAYAVEVPSSKVKIIVEMNDGSSYVNQQYFFVGKKDADAEKASEASKETEKTSEKKKDSKKDK